MRTYFTQFGAIKRLRLSRNRTTGASKHYAFVEFSSASVAQIVASTMNNYLMFGHILKCKLVPKDQVHEKIWVGANKRFKRVPWSRIEGRKLAIGMDREGWGKRIETEKKRREAKNEAMKRIGYEFDMGELKGVEDILVREDNTKIEGREDSTKIEGWKPTTLMIEEKETAVIEVASEGNILAVSEKITTQNLSRESRKNATKKKLAGKAIGADQVIAPIAKNSEAAGSATIVATATPANEQPIDILSPAPKKPKAAKRRIGDEATPPPKKIKKSKKTKAEGQVEEPTKKRKKAKADS